MNSTARNDANGGAPNRTHTILLGDDDRGVRTMLADLLRADGFEVIEAEDRLQAVEIYREQTEKIDLVLLDMSRSRLSVEDSLAILRAINSVAKVVLVSGNARRDDVDHAMASGVDAFIPKPFRLSELLDPLHRLIDATQRAVA